MRLGLNIDHVATLRQQRAGLVTYPDVVEAARVGMAAGADLITVHVRGDRRHIQEFDLKNLTDKKFPINLEMAATDEMVAMALKFKPVIVCLVPEKREELTTEGGLDVVTHLKKITEVSAIMLDAGIRVSLFIEGEEKQIEASQKANATAVELHTGHYANAKTEKPMHFENLKKSCIQAHRLGLQVHAGHGLDYQNISEIKTLPYLEEVNIGHSIICESVFMGLHSAVQKMKSLIL